MNIPKIDSNYRPLEIIINGIVLLPYNDDYYVSDSGDVFSYRSRKFLKHGIDIDGYHRVDIYGKHIKIHRMTYQTWIGEIPEGFQINHQDDDKDNNYALNLYAGNQKQNRRDCINNGHVSLNIYRLIVKDRNTGEVLTFCPAGDFLNYAGHPAANGGVKRALTRDWFVNNYELIEYNRVGKV